MTKEEKILLLIDELEDIRCNNFDGDTDEDKTLKEVVSVIKTLAQQSCDDAISRKEVLEQTYNWSKDEFLRVTNPFDYLRKRINSLPSVNTVENMDWISIEKYGYPKPEDEYERFLTIDDRNEVTIQEFLLSIDEEPQPYFTGWRNIVAWMPLPKSYKGEYR